MRVLSKLIFAVIVSFVTCNTKQIPEPHIQQQLAITPQISPFQFSYRSSLHLNPYLHFKPQVKYPHSSIKSPLISPVDYLFSFFQPQILYQLPPTFQPIPFIPIKPSPPLMTELQKPEIMESNEKPVVPEAPELNSKPEAVAPIEKPTETSEVNLEGGIGAKNPRLPKPMPGMIIDEDTLAIEPIS